MHRRPIEDDLKAVRPAAEWAEALLVAAGADDALRNDVQVCLEEVLANLILHARPRGASKDIAISLSAAPGSATLIVTDRCAPFDITDDALNAAPTAVGEIRIGGNGVKLIRALAGRVQYTAQGEQNELRLEFGADAKRSVLRAIPALRKVPLQDMNILLESAEDLTFEPGETLLHQGDRSAFAYVLLKGEVTIVNESAHGDAALASIVAPALVGEIGALSQSRRTASVRAKTSVEALKVNRKTLLKVGKHAPAMLVSVIAQTGQQIQSINNALGLYAAGLAALEHDDFNPKILAELNNPSADLRNFADAFQRLASRVTQERRTRAEMASAALIQRAMLPAPIDPAALAGRCTAFATMKPAREVGGDLFDLSLLSDNRLALVVGDVCGKGVPASLFMSATVTALRIAAQHDREIGTLIATANDALYAQNAMSMFTTLFYGVLDLETSTLSYVNCGHNPPLHVRASGGCAELAGRGPPLGFFPGQVWQAHTVRLAPGDGVFLFTDGVTECLNIAGEEYGDERLAALVSQQRADAEAVVQAVVADAEAFAAGAEQADDITCVAAFLPPKS
jgi:phosphoserine phosphatase RsbU/P